MPEVKHADSPERVRNLLFMGQPSLWSVWPFLPLIRREVNSDDYDCGLLFDVFHLDRHTGFSATVVLSNLFELPATVEEVLKLPHEHYDTVEEVYAAGWRVD